MAVVLLVPVGCYLLRPSRIMVVLATNQNSSVSIVNAAETKNQLVEYAHKLVFFLMRTLHQWRTLSRIPGSVLIITRGIHGWSRNFLPRVAACRGRTTSSFSAGSLTVYTYMQTTVRSTSPESRSTIAISVQFNFPWKAYLNQFLDLLRLVWKEMQQELSLYELEFLLAFFPLCVDGQFR